MLPAFVNVPHAPRTLRATEKVLTRLYESAKMGLKGDSLALAAGMLPMEYRQLCQMDDRAALIALKGKADAELEHASKLAEASLAGDAKASLAILQHAHGWTARQEIDLNANHMVDIKTLLAERAARIFDNDATLTATPTAERADA